MSKSTLSFRDMDNLFEAAGASGIRHRAQRAIYEGRRDDALAKQLAATAAELDADPRFGVLARELRLAASKIQTTLTSHWSGRMAA